MNGNSLVNRGGSSKRKEGSGSSISYGEISPTALNAAAAQLKTSKIELFKSAIDASLQDCADLVGVLEKRLGVVLTEGGVAYGEASEPQNLSPMAETLRVIDTRAQGLKCQLEDLIGRLDL